MKKTAPVLVVGSGPAGLMAATVLSANAVPVFLCEKQKALGRKLLIAGGSGLNIASALPHSEMLQSYEGAGIDWQRLFERFSVDAWLRFIESLGLKTFKGTSDRYFVEEMKAANLLKRWVDLLEKQGVQLKSGCDLVAISLEADGQIAANFADGAPLRASAAILALGGGSWLPQAESAEWPKLFAGTGVQLEPFTSANCGFSVTWKKEFVAEIGRQALKNIVLQTPRGSRKGDVMVTDYGVEGTPIYAVGEAGECFLDLKPDLSPAAIRERLAAARENLSPLRRAVKQLQLDPVRAALLFHHAPSAALASVEGIAEIIKKFPVRLLEPRPLAEAISSRGGIALSEIDKNFMMQKMPGVFAAGEMLDWHAPTGGFLIQACVAQGYAAGEAAVHYCRQKDYA